MVSYDTDKILEQVQDALRNEDVTSAIRILESLHPTDKAEVFEDLDEEDQMIILPQMDPATSADILEDMDDSEVAELIDALSSESAARIVDEMEPDEAADVLGDISADKAQIILTSLDNPEEIQPLMLHPDESAGGLMTSEFLALRRRMTAAQAIEAVRQWHPSSEATYYLFIVDGEGHLCGVISLRQLVVADPDTRLADVMNPDVIRVQVGTDQEECARLMTRYDLLALPVVDANEKLLGLITVDDVVDVLVEEATEDIQRMGGAQPLDTPYLLTPIRTVFRTRVGWLLLLFVTESLTGTVLRYFEAELQAVVALSFFIPLLIGTGGNAGSQTTSTIIRALALGEIRLRDALRALWHELRVGLALGVIMSVIAYLRALSWHSTPGLAITVSLAILAIVIWANVLGAVLPLLASRLRVDPAVVSGPVMSTLVDATGLFIYFTVAHLILL